MWPTRNTPNNSISRPGLALAGTAFHRNDCPCGETIQGGMGDLESRKPSSGGRPLHFWTTTNIETGCC
jgi:hypothetical protein